MKMSMLKTTVIRFSTLRHRKTLKWPVLWVETWVDWRMTSPIISDRWRAMQASRLVVTRARLSTCMTLMQSLTAMMLWRTREKSIKPLPKSYSSKTSKRSVTLSRSPLLRSRTRNFQTKGRTMMNWIRTNPVKTHRWRSPRRCKLLKMKPMTQTRSLELWMKELQLKWC